MLDQPTEATGLEATAWARAWSSSFTSGPHPVRDRLHHSF